MTVEMAALGSPFPMSLMVSVDVKQHSKKKTRTASSEKKERRKSGR